MFLFTGIASFMSVFFLIVSAKVRTLQSQPFSLNVTELFFGQRPLMTNIKLNFYFHYIAEARLGFLDKGLDFDVKAGLWF